MAVDVPKSLIGELGIGLSVYSRRAPGVGLLNLIFDGAKLPVMDLNSTDPDNSPTRLSCAEELKMITITSPAL